MTKITEKGGPELADSAPALRSCKKTTGIFFRAVFNFTPSAREALQGKVRVRKAVAVKKSVNLIIFEQVLRAHTLHLYLTSLFSLQAILCAEVTVPTRVRFAVQPSVSLYYVDTEGVCIHFPAVFDILLQFPWYMHVAFSVSCMVLSLSIKIRFPEVSEKRLGH